ncbi:pseudouridine synthase family protein [Artemisia annua]|uniref:tRNA pseudouridine synthase n=1 Tax=Artemisia annua TaxID=35608 RepID=A0A2U1QBB0_ARTAN|nr:pseudouridine synthase family protein [Artemisia annua]
MPCRHCQQVESMSTMVNTAPKPWEKVVNFYSNLVNGQTTLVQLFGAKTQHAPDDIGIESSDEPEYVVTAAQKRAGRWARMNFKIVLSYHGGSFDGWQKQPGLNTVQEVIEKSLGKFVDERKAGLLKDKGRPLEGNVVVAGRTDKGVTGFQQTQHAPDDIGIESSDEPEYVVTAAQKRAGRWARMNFKIVLSYHGGSFDGWQKQPGLNTVQEVIEKSLGKFVDERKAGLLKDKGRPLEGNVVVAGRTDKGVTGFQQVCSFYNHDDGNAEESLESTVKDDVDDQQSIKKPTTFSVSKVNQLLQQLEGKLLSYKMFARDTKPSRNTGPPTECFLFHARATEVTLNINTEKGENSGAMCVELVGNRFLRKMVRVLVATSIREAAAGAEDDALLKLMDATCRRATAPPAPPDGLCLVDVGYNEFDSQTCLIK